MPRAKNDRSAVVDIGSNSVRMVVFAGDDRSLEPIFNEKAMSGLGRDLLSTGRLHPAGRVSALAILARFREIAAYMRVGRISAVATAAARAAIDGPEFIRLAEAALDAPIDVIAGEEEARLSALGVICGAPDADGVIGDLGGGSLEIAEVSGGAVANPMSLPIGPLALGSIVGGRLEARRIAAGLAQCPAGLAEGRALYAVGGSWRALAKHYFERKNYPIRIIHQFELDVGDARDFLRGVGRVKASDSGRLKGISSRRRNEAPFAARLLLRLTDRLQPHRIVFSGFGLREGVEFERMSTAVRLRDPLIDHCRAIGQSGARVPFDGEALATWALGAFDAPPAEMRIVRAAAWLSDMSGSDHPDYRGHHAAARALHMAVAGISHQDRVFLAAAVYARYHGYGMETALGKAAGLLDEGARRLARALGMTFRLGHAIAPGDSLGVTAGLRSHFSLRRESNRLILVAEGIDPALLGETARRRLASLARALEVEADVESVQSAAA